ncbi:MAG TPA: DNA-protecting protein DprA [Alphaproteobacteria bacterium]|nr:DNA-protecting protein DprA [Alphaproteobacteria bacterium]
MIAPKDTVRAKELSASEKLDWLRLIRSENVGPITFYRLLEHFGSAAGAIEAAPELSRRGGRARPIKICAKAAAMREIEALESLGAKLIARDEPDYPPLMSKMEDAPPVISVIGHSHLLSKKAVAIVGARNASLNGRNFATRIARELGEAKFLVVSGMARGIDAAAHTGALDSGTVAVLGGGVDVIYPKENEDLYKEIAGRGAVISEMPPGTRPLARHFPQRNRLISGMARGVVVVEAAARSGSLITARMALDQNREVFAVPGFPSDPRARGANDLIRQGAAVCESAKDVLAVLDHGKSILRDRNPLEFQRVNPDLPAAEEVEKGRSRIEECLSPAPLTVDEIIRTCQLSPPVVCQVLLELELAGRLERHPGNKVSKIDG